MADMAGPQPVSFFGQQLTSEKVSAFKMSLEMQMDSMQAPDYLRKTVNESIDNIVRDLNRFQAERIAAGRVKADGC